MKATRSILGLSAAHLVTDLYTPVLPAILPLLILEHGYPYFWAGLIVTVYQLSSSLTQPVVGWFYDKKGYAIRISYTVFLSAFFISLIGIINNYSVILIFAALGALGHAFFHPSALGTVSKLAKDSARGRLTSYFVVGGNLGFAIGPIAAGIVVGLFGLPGLVVLLIPGLFTAGILHWILPPPAPLSPEVVTDDIAASSKNSKKSAIVILVIGSALRSWAIFASIAYLPTYLTQLGADVVNANLQVSGMLLAGVVGQIVGGTLSDRYGRKEYTLAGLSCAIIPFVVFLNTSGIIASIALLIFGFCLWSTFSVTVAMAHELMPTNVGLVSGLMLGLAVGAGGVGVAVIGYIADLSSLFFALSLLVVPIIAAIILFLLIPYPWKLFLKGKRKGDLV
jgi:FSR family fosmidomycin resistance protein-like MFS transporter